MQPSRVESRQSSSSRDGTCGKKLAAFESGIKAKPLIPFRAVSAELAAFESGIKAKLDLVRIPMLVELAAFESGIKAKQEMMMNSVP